MLLTIPILTCLVFSTLYPLCLWISNDDPLKNSYHRNHLGITNFVSGVAVVILLFMNIPVNVKILVVFWKILLLSISRYYWRKGYVNTAIITLPSVVGIVSFLTVQQTLLPDINNGQFATLLGGSILCLSIYTLNLGHWYLNVPGLSVHHLDRGVNIFSIFVFIRTAYDGVLILSNSVVLRTDIIPLYDFIWSMDGFLLLIPLFFGTIFPLIALIFVKGTVKIHSTQSATGILYVVLIAVLIADMSYKYYLIKLGIVL